MRYDVLLLDGTNLAHRCWYVGGEARVAEDLFVGMIRKALDIYMPSFAAVALDSGKCFRKEFYPSYKAKRGEMPDDQKAWIYGLVDAAHFAGVPCVTAPNHEADDIIATLAKQASPRSTLIMTSDKDALALVTETCHVFQPGTANILGVSEVIGKMGVPPWQVRAYKALVGDPSDNIGGVPGIGKVKALKLLAENPASTLDEFRALLAKLTKPPVRVELDEAIECGTDAWDVVGLVDDAPVTRDLRACAVLPDDVIDQDGWLPAA